MDINFDLDFFESKEESKFDSNFLYDIAIIGGGPAALTAAVYSLRKGMKTAIIAKEIGGQVMETASIENYMGFRIIEGTQLIEKFKEQIKIFESLLLENTEVTKLEIENSIKRVTLSNGETIKAKAIIIATGKTPKRLNIPGEAKFIGKGVNYCAICDAPLYSGKHAIVAGGGNSGVEAAIDLAKLCEKVYLIHRSERLKADSILIEKLYQYKNIEILLNCEPKEIKGEKRVEEVVVNYKNEGEERIIKVDGIFVEIGLKPNTEFLKDFLKLNGIGEVEVNGFCNTNIEGIFAAGDVTDTKYKQIIIAAGEGAKAALSAYEYILRN